MNNTTSNTCWKGPLKPASHVLHFQTIIQMKTIYRSLIWLQYLFGTTDDSDFDSEKRPLFRWACFRLSSSSQSGFRFSISSFAFEFSEVSITEVLTVVRLAGSGGFGGGIFDLVFSSEILLFSLLFPFVRPVKASYKNNDNAVFNDHKDTFSKHLNMIIWNVKYYWRNFKISQLKLNQGKGRCIYLQNQPSFTISLNIILFFTFCRLHTGMRKR